MRILERLMSGILFSRFEMLFVKIVYNIGNIINIIESEFIVKYMYTVIETGDGSYKQLK